MKNTKTAEAKETKATKSSQTKSSNKKMENKSAFDIMLETQNKFMEGFMGNSNMLEQFKGNEMVEKSREFVNEFLEKQQETLETSMESFKKQVQFDSAPEMVKETLAAQQELGKEWFLALRNMVKAKDAQELNTILNANVQKMQDNMKEFSTLVSEGFSKPNEVFTQEYAKDLNKKVLEMSKPAK